jgi:polysaccharide export outer membrane protein
MRCFWGVRPRPFQEILPGRLPPGFAARRAHAGGGRKGAGLALALGLLVALPGCASHDMRPLTSADRAAGIAGYRVGAGDKLRITVFNEPTLTGEYNVTPTGAVAFPLIGAVQAGTHTTEEVTAEITGRLAGPMSTTRA